jgi:DNA invertase Pin-like site-specific DNA recombinase
LSLGFTGSPASTSDLLNVLDQITKAGAGFKSFADAWADTTTPHGRLMLTVLVASPSLNGN